MKIFFRRLKHRKKSKHRGDVSNCPTCRTAYSTRLGDGYLVEWCRVCDSIDLKAMFGKWESGNTAINNLIQMSQLNAPHHMAYLEWVEPGELSNIKALTDDGLFGSIYTATWDKGVRDYKQIDKNGLWKKSRSGPTTVALKTLYNSDGVTKEFLFDVYIYSLCQAQVVDTQGIAQIYGVTRHPDTNEFAFVMEYFSLGSLHSRIQSEEYRMTWQLRVKDLMRLSTGLTIIHINGIIHRNLHGGNILIRKNTDGTETAVISDLGLCKPVYDDSSARNGKYGVIPYMAPELFQAQPYSHASDIYAMGMLMWELSSERLAFQDRGHNTQLMLEIYDGLRPDVVDGTPRCWTKLMQRCWDDDPMKRPQAVEIVRTTRHWIEILAGNIVDDDISQQFSNADEYSGMYARTRRNEKHPDAEYRSHFVPHITEEMLIAHTRSMQVWDSIEEDDWAKALAEHALESRSQEIGVFE